MKRFKQSSIFGAINNSLHSSNLTLLFLLMTSITVSGQTTWTVTSSADVGHNTLREAIDFSVDGDIIDINVSSEIMIESGLYVYIKDLTINGNGATINSANSSDYTFFFEISNTTINDLTMKNLSHNFPVIRAIDDGQITLNHCIIKDNPTTAIAGAISSNIPIIINDCTLQNNTGRDAGGINMQFNSLTIHNSIISGNTATGYFGTGGISCSGPFKMTNSEIINNNAPNGWTGGLQAYSSAIIEISGSKINNNSGNTVTGGCVIFGALALTNSEIVNNTCNGTGGGIQFISFGGTTPSIISNSTISQNTAKNSGGIHYQGTTLTINNSRIDQNKATQNSGGGLVMESGKLTLNNSTVNNNEAKSTGGGIYSNVDCIIDGSEVNNNTSLNTGGGIYMNDGKLELRNQTEVNGNTASIDGGGIYLNSNASTQLIATNSSINSNKTIHWGGGGIYIRPNGHTKILTNCELKNNSANTQGGAIYNQGGLQLNSVTMTGNKAQWGGGLYVWSGQAEINHSSLDMNEASSDGGGVYSRSKLTIRNNSTFNNNTAGQTGGGLWISHSGQVSTITASQVNDNEAQRAAGILIGDGVLTIDQGSQVNSNTNVSSFDGAGIYNSNAALTIHSSSVNNNTTPTNGGGIFVANGGHASLTTNQADITGNTAGQYGGGIYLSTIGNIQNSTINQNTATGPGGGIYVRELSGAKLSLAGGSISDNTASHGGGIMLYPNNNANTISNCNIKNNEVTQQGGGAWIKANTSITGSTFESNSAVAAGGGIFMDQGTSSITASNIKMNTAVNGAGIYKRTGTLNIASTTIEQNESTDDGGGIYLNTGPLTISDQSHINNNKAPGFNGGGIYSKGDLILNQSTLNDNQAKNGAGFYAKSGTATIQNNAEINTNKATYRGGGIYTEIELSISGSAVDNNTASNDGGGVYALEKLTISTPSTFNNNTAGQTGGGLWISHSGQTSTISGSQVNGNEARRAAGIYMNEGNIKILQSSNVNNNTNTSNYNGAGIYNMNAVLTIQNSNVNNNKTSLNGGGIFVDRGLNAALICDNATISDNVSQNESGGGIYMFGGSLQLKNGSKVTGNTAEKDGGGIYLSNHNSVQFTASNCSINDNKTIRYGGGGIHIRPNGHTKTLTNCELKNNAAKTEGGAIYNQGSLQLNNVTMKENQASQGGGLYVWSGMAEIKNTSIDQNTASNNGGGVFSRTGLTIENNSIINDNTCGQYGGGLYLGDGAHSIKNAEIMNNTSNNSGGGIYFNKESLTLDNVKVNNNTSDGSKGGGIHNEKGALTITNSEVNGNSAFTWGGGIYSSYLTGAISFSISNSEVNSNSANNGGGISVDVINNYSITNTEFKNNTAQNNGGAINIIGGTGMVDIGQVTIINNQAKRGGGINNTSLDLMVNNSTINNNQSTHNGGGIYNENNKITLTNSEINGNTSNYNGGGIWNNGNLNISNSEIRENTARYWGGGIHNLGTATVQKMIIEGNTAKDGGGIANVANMSIDYTTITNNSADHGGGLQNLNSGGYHGNLTLQNSIVSLNHGSNGTDIDNKASISGDHNLLSDYTGSGLTANSTNNLTGDPLFVSDFNNLNLTKCSPAIDAASNGDDMGALQSGLTAIVPVITTASITVALDDQHPNLVSIDPSMVSYNFMGCTDITISLTPVNFDCSHVGQTVTTTATVTYSGGQSFQQPIPVIVLDQVAPHFTSFPPDTVYVAAGDPVPAPDPVTYVDNCGGAVTLNVSNSTPATLKCGEKIYRTYTIADVHGNTSSFVQVIIIGDGVGPKISVWDEHRMDITDLMTPPVYTVRHDTAYISFTNDAVLTRYCGQSQLIQRTYTALDACHNESTQTLNIMFSDEEKPVLTKEADFLQSVKNGDTIAWVDCIYPDPSRNDISWSDNSGKAVVKTHVYPLPLPDPAPFGLFKFLNYVYEVEDDCGNASELNFYMGLYDLQGPKFQYIPYDTVITSTVDLPPVPDDVIILDVCNYVVWDTVVTRPIIDPWTADTTAFVRRWVARDIMGHETFEEQIIYIKSDNNSYGEVTARIAYHDELIPKHFDGEIGENGIHVYLHRLNSDDGENVVADSTTTQNWFGRNGTAWMTGILPGSYQVKVEIPEGFYIRNNNLVDSLGWSDTVVFDGELVDLGLLVLTPVAEPEEKDVQPRPSIAQNTISAQKQEWMVYPNPSNGQVKIEYKSNEQYYYDLYDRTGKRVRSGRTTNGSIIHLDDLINGIYVLQLRNGNDIIGHKKLVLMK